MADGFVALADFLRRDARGEEASTLPAASEPQAAYVAPSIAQARRFYAALADALDASMEELRRDLASEVLARELVLQPCDMRAIATRLVERYAQDGPVTLLANAEDARDLGACAIPVRTDPSLRRGDCTLVVRYGTIDASLGVRLAGVL
jgi:flagellar biosynthesis/type III secretory pathway protein FliH